MVEQVGDLDEIELTPDQARIAELEAKLKLVQETASKDAEAAAENHANELAELQGQLADLRTNMKCFIDERYGQLKKAVRMARPAWVREVTARIAVLPSSWAPSMVARKVEDPNFIHPLGLADFTPKVDDNGNLIRVDGEMIPQ